MLRVAKNAWSYTHQGRNRFGQHGAWFPTDEVIALTAPGRHDALILLAYLRGQNGPDATFMIANGMAKNLGWDRERFAKTRKLLVELDSISRPPITTPDRPSGALPNRRIARSTIVCVASAVSGVLLGWLPHHRIAADESESGIPGPDRHRKVESRDDATDAERMPSLHHTVVGALG